MTAIAGFYCSDGLLVCADMEESSVSSKRSVHKLYHKTFGQTADSAWDVVIGGAGTSIIINNVIGRLKGPLEMMNSFDAGLFSKTIEEVLRHVHEHYIWPNKSTNHEFQLLLGVSPGADTLRG